MADFLVHTREMLPIEASPEVLEAERLLSLLKAHCETHGLSAVAMVAPSRETLEHFAMDGPPVRSVTVRTGPVAACVFLAGTLLMGVKERLDEAQGARVASVTLFQADPSGVRPPDGSFRRFDLGRGWIDANQAALPTMQDVAREAGVCLWTAYEAFRTGGDREPRISARAANAVMDAAERLGYVPKGQVGEYERMVLEQAARGGRNG